MSVHINASLVRHRVVTPPPHYTNTFVKLAIVTHLFFSERLAIANLSCLPIGLDCARSKNLCCSLCTCGFAPQTFHWYITRGGCPFKLNDRLQIFGLFSTTLWPTGRWF